MVIWIIGLSGSGKSFLANKIYKNLNKKRKKVICIDGDGSIGGSDLGLLLSSWGACPVQDSRKVVAYYIEWGIYGRNYQPADMPLDSITHVNYAFANIGSDGRIAIGDPYAATEKLYPGDTWDQPYAGTYNQLNNVLRAQHPHIKTLISVGGWTWSGKFSDVALTEESRSVFAESCLDFIRTYNFDGVDIDWEYPSFVDSTRTVFNPSRVTCHRRSGVGVPLPMFTIERRRAF